jgi:transketolase
LGEATLSALTEPGAEAVGINFEHLAVRGMPGSGKSEELMKAAGISSGHITDAVRGLLDR